MMKIILTRAPMARFPSLLGRWMSRSDGVRSNNSLKGMGLVSQFIKSLYLNTEGGPVKRTVLSILIGGSFAVITALFLIIPIRLEHYLQIPVLIIKPVNYFIGIPLITVGVFFMSWTSLLFFVKKGTPVPNTAPPKLITSGPYALSRNPMHGGLFLMMFGVGFYNSSLLTLLISIPLYIYLDTRIHKYIEEPELEKRFGQDYAEYRKSTPRFLPRLFKSAKI